MDDVSRDSDGTKFHWTLTGTNTGSGGTGKRVRITGYALWKIDNDGLICESKGHLVDACFLERVAIAAGSRPRALLRPAYGGDGQRCARCDHQLARPLGAPEYQALVAWRGAAS